MIESFSRIALKMENNLVKNFFGKTLLKLDKILGGFKIVLFFVNFRASQTLERHG